ncbi:alpha-amylase family glycosyl hydrolase [Herpetosiphon giganteus]|uniref:alpha-amylase family glycosyl hydrolase n=1 Tax=Herpetosiphon giganteus TaxID=2029754 RepID=UPI0019583495|nr:alpha-amylase family glycosyl hydrolase [Herpetosiphon giganteus]MBM7845945.1 1,4-alpha-glucan branching enzyme/DNA-binding beta-propeller fold protein YncE [Herpetosiphon giganteus]
MSSAFESFHLTIAAPHGDRYPVTARTQAGHEVSEPLLLPLDDPTLTVYQTALDYHTPIDESVVIAVGQLLYQTLFQGTIAEAFATARTHADQHNAALRIQLAIDTDTRLSAAAALPWELMATEAGRPLMLEHALVRTFPWNDPIPTLGISSGERIRLAVTSALPMELANLPIAAEAEVEIIRAAITHSSRPIDLIEIPHLTRDRLTDLLTNQRPHIVHHIGHGNIQRGMGYLDIERADQSRDRLSAREFSTMIHQSGVQLVVFSAGENLLTSFAPIFMTDRIPAVIGMQAVILNRTGHCFANAFYATLGTSGSIDQALIAARKAILADGHKHGAWGFPTLYSRVPHGQLWGDQTPQPVDPLAQRDRERITKAAQQIESDRLLTLRLQGFVGRVNELAAIRGLIEAMRSTGGYVLIKAAAGEGKSSIIAKMVQEAGIAQTPHHFIALTTGREYQLGLLRAVVAQLILKHNLTVSYFPEESYPAMKGEFVRILDDLSKQGIHETIYLDDLDQLQPESDGSRDLSFLPPQPPPGIVIVLGSRPDETLKPLEILHRVDYDLPPLSEPDALALWRSVQPDVENELLHDLYTALKGNALFVHLAADTMQGALVVNAISLTRQIDHNPSNLFGITLERMKSRSQTQWDTVWKPMLALLLVAQEPLRLAVLGNLLGHDYDTMQDAVWVLGGLVSQGIDQRVALHHLLFRDYLTASVFNPREVKRWHQRLADWCAKDGDAIWTDDRDPIEQARRVYARNHYSTHLALAADQATILFGHTSSLESVAVTPDGRLIITGSIDTTIKVWDAESCELVRTFIGHTAAVWGAVINADGSRVASASSDRTIRVWDIETGTTVSMCIGHSAAVFAVAMTSDRRIVSGSDDQTVRVWDSESGALIFSFAGHTAGVWTVAVTPRGDLAISGSEDRTLRIWDLYTGQAQRTLTGHTGAIRHIVVTPDGRLVISSSEDGTLRLWNIVTGVQERTIATDRDGFTGVAITPDGQMILAGSQNGNVIVWDATTGAVLETFTGHSDAVYRIAVTPDSRTAISASRDTTARFWTLPIPPIKANLPEGVWMGAYDRSEGKVSFALYAPGKKSIHLIGSFNGWDRTADPLAVSKQGIWWIVKNLPAGEHAYQFVIDGKTIIGDPYAREVRWIGGSQPATIIRVGTSTYQWNDDGFLIKPLNQLLIYEIHVGDFSPEGTFKGIIERLSYLQDLGVTAIQLMPIFEFPGDNSWGYNPSYYFAPKTSYGTLNDLRDLIDLAHQHGIGIFLDVVFSLIDSSSPINYLYPYDENPYFSSDASPWGFPTLNHQSEIVKQLLSDVQTYWLVDMHVDGLRYYYAIGIGDHGENGISFLTWQARQVKSHVYLIVENTDDYTSMVRNTDADASWSIPFRNQMIANLRESEFNGKQYADLYETMRHFRAIGYTGDPQMINFIEMHDEQRLFYEVMNNPNIQPDIMYHKSKLGAITLFTAVGVPMLYHGQEFGMKTERIVEQNKLQWELLQDAQGNDLHSFYRRMSQLHAKCRALFGNNIAPLIMDDDRKLLAYYRWSDDQSSHVVVVLNFGINTEYLDVPFPRGGIWHEWINNDDHNMVEGVSSIEITGSSGKVFVLDSLVLSVRSVPLTYGLNLNLPLRSTVGQTVQVSAVLIAMEGPITLPVNLDEVYCAISPTDTLMHLCSPNLATMTRRIDGTFITQKFELQAKLPGEHTFTIDLYIEDPQTGQRTRYQSNEYTISVDAPAYTEFPTPLPRLDVQVGMLPPFLLQVDTHLPDGANGSCMLTYRLSSRLRGKSLWLADVGTCLLPSGAISRLQSMLVTARHHASSAAPKDAQAILLGFGTYLYDLLFPLNTAAAFREHFWLNAESITNWLIVEQGNIWLPWELVAPYQDDQAPRFLGERYELSRWIHGLGSIMYPEIVIGDLALATYQNTATAHANPARWAQLLGAKLTNDIGTVADPDQGFYGLHVLRAIDTTTGREIMPRGVSLAQEESQLHEQTFRARLDLQRKRPLITLSMLRSTTMTSDDDEWLLPERVLPFLRAGASAVVGPWWSTCAAADRIFWSTFYDLLGFQNVTLGVALHRARHAVVQALPGNPDALAYTSFGNPQARPYQPEVSDGYTVLECLDDDDPLQSHKAYTFRASVRLAPPEWHHQRLVRVQKLPDNMTVLFMAPNLEPAFSDPIAMEMVSQQMLAATIRLMAPKQGIYRLNAQFFQDNEYLKTMQISFTVADKDAGDTAYE